MRKYNLYRQRRQQHTVGLALAGLEKGGLFVLKKNGCVRFYKSGLVHFEKSRMVRF
jgi:hypothetical protein